MVVFQQQTWKKKYCQDPGCSTSGGEQKTSNVGEMDKPNADICKVWIEEGEKAAVKKMFEHPTKKDSDGNPKKLSYSEMRSLYG